jgi:hypothetical protein
MTGNILLAIKLILVGKRLRLTMSCPAGILLLCLLAQSQGTSGLVTGVVYDPDNRVVPSAWIVFVNSDTGQRRELVTSSDGSYWLNGLPTGRYEARAEREGFRSDERTGVVITVAQELVVNFKLGILPISEEISVASEGSSIETGTTAISAVVVSQKIRDLPLNGRDLGQLILLQPGIVNSRSSVQSANTGRGIRFSAAGARPNQNLFSIDGTTINDALNNTPGSAQGLLLGVETVKEFRVLTMNFGAEYGRVAGGIFLGVTKSGSNEIHGSIFEFFRNDIFDARNFFDTGKPEFLRNQFGFSAGGPLIRNRTFWFGSYEGLREHKGVTRVSLVPDEEARSGRLPAQPAVSVDPRSQPILELFPHPNGANLGDGTAAFIGTTNRLSRGDFFTIKLDHNFASDAISVRYLFDDSEQVLPRNFPEFPNFALNRKQVVTIEERKILSNTVVNEARFGFNRSRPAEQVPRTSRDLSLIAGQDLGEINVVGLTEIGTDRTNPKGFFLNSFQAGDILFLARGRTNLKLGGSFDRFQYNGTSESRTRGLLRFRSVADLLRFRVRDLEGATPDSDFARGYRQNLLGVFVQDEFKLTSRLTLNGGVRYEWVSTPGEVNGKEANLRNVLDKEVTVGGPYFRPSHHSLAPRVGLALDASGDGKAVIRSGFGIYFDQPLFHIFRSPAFRSLPFVNRGRLTSVTALPVEPSRFKGVESATEALQFQLQPSYSMRYNLNLQREVSGTVLSISYLGSRGINLVGGTDANIAYPQVQQDGREFFPEGGLRRNRSFAQVRTILQGFSSSYNAMTAGIIRHFQNDLQFQLAYAYGKSIDDATGISRLDFSNGQARSFDPYNRRLNRALSDFDTRHTLTANASYKVPLGRNFTGVLKQLADGWQVNTILMVTSGVPFTPLVDGDPDRDGTDENAARPNWIQGASLIPAGGRTPDLWFNPQAFAPPEVGFRGTAGRNIITGPDYKSVDVSLVKVFALGETRRIEFRAEAFNLFNRANFDLPSNSEDGELVFNYLPASGGIPARFVQASGVGRIFTTVGDSREFQFALKFVF